MKLAVIIYPLLTFCWSITGYFSSLIKYDIIYSCIHNCLHRISLQLYFVELHCVIVYTHDSFYSALVFNQVAFVQAPHNMNVRVLEC